MRCLAIMVVISSLIACKLREREAFASSSSATAAGAINPRSPHRLQVPPTGVFVGAALGGGAPAEFNARTAIKHAIFVEFFRFPEILTDESMRTHIDTFVDAAIAVEAVPLLTLETFGGLESYGEAEIIALARILDSYGYPVILRWNHEMNGSWYPWGQQPELYKAKFREFATILRAQAPLVSMAWAPNQEYGFPFPGLEYANPNIDKTDAYAQFYPGDDVVDFVGLSFYHWGVDASGKTGSNLLPQANSWHQGLQHFHDSIAQAHNKPMIVAETAALYNPGQGGSEDLAIKSAWLRQVYSPETLQQQFSQLRAIIWFAVNKTEAETNGRILWSFDYLPEALALYQERLRSSYFMQSEAIQTGIRN